MHITVLQAVGCFRHLMPELKTFMHYNHKEAFCHQCQGETTFSFRVLNKCNIPQCNTRYAGNLRDFPISHDRFRKLNSSQLLTVSIN